MLELLLLHVQLYIDTCVCRHCRWKT